MFPGSFIAHALFVPLAPHVDSVFPDELFTGDPEVQVIAQGYGFTGATAVTVDGVSVTFNVLADDELELFLDPDDFGEGAYDVVVTSPAGSSSPVTLTVSAGGGVAPAPTITSADPDVGDTTATHAGLMTITGTGFVSGATVAIGGAAATSVTFVNATTITCRPPARASGLHDIVVTNPDAQTGTLANGYRAWTPIEIPGCVLYWDSRKNVVDDGAGAVTTWNGVSPIGVVSYVANGFGTGVPVIRFPGSGAIFILSSWIPMAAGASKFWVGKHTSADGDVVYSGNAPLTVIGDGTGNAYTEVGFAADKLCLTQYPGHWDGASGIHRGSGLNDGTTRLVGWTHDHVSGDAKAYVGTTQQGATETSLYNTDFDGFDRIGCGYTGDYYDGDLGAAVVASGVISSANQLRLHKWSRLSFGAAS